MTPARWRDRLYVAVLGGLRVRIEAGEVSFAGQVPGPPPVRLASLVQELARGADGVVSINRGRGGYWSIASSGALASASFEQRLRNVLGNS